MNTQDHNLGRMIETDVLVLGSGASGCGAAIGARKKGASVLVLDKAKLESSGCCGGGNDHFMAVLNEGAPTDTLESFLGFFAKPIGGWSTAMLEKGWYRNMRPMLQMLDEAGVEFVRESNGTFRRTQGFGQPGAWWVHISKGMLLKRKLAMVVRSLGIDVLDHAMAVRIMTDGGRACGALAWNVENGEFYLIKAKSVVSAQGRGAARTSNNSTRNPFNIWQYPYNTSGGFVLGLQAGVKMMNMDTYQRATLLPKGYGAPGMNGINSMGGKQLNALGERFMFKYDPMGENGIRANQIQGTYQELIEGKGPPFFIDMTHFDPAEANHLQYVLMPGDKATYNDWTDALGIDFKHDPLEVELSEITLGGLLYTDDNFETNVSRLFNGSVFPYFSGALCGGFAAGEQAAMAARGIDTFLSLDEDLAAEVKQRTFAPLHGDGNLSYQELENTLRNIMDYYVGFRRSRKGLEKAITKIDFLAGHQKHLKANDLRQLMRCLEAMELLVVSRLCIEATMRREESGRSIYSRSDFPELNPQLSNPLVLWQEDGRFRFQWGKQ